ncbi:MAG: hypothetical protein ACYC2I_12125, partial [Elusimicrobiales bacterium]
MKSFAYCLVMAGLLSFTGGAALSAKGFPSNAGAIAVSVAGDDVSVDVDGDDDAPRRGAKVRAGRTGVNTSGKGAKVRAGGVAVDTSEDGADVDVDMDEDMD